MRSRIRSVIPKKIIGINISSQKRDVISEIAKSENAEAEFFGSEVSAQQVGYLCGFKGFARSGKEGEDITDECLIFSGIDGRSLDPILKKTQGERCGGGAKSHCHGTQSKLERWRAYKRAEA